MVRRGYQPKAGLMPAERPIGGTQVTPSPELKQCVMCANKFPIAELRGLDKDGVVWPLHTSDPPSIIYVRCSVPLSPKGV